MNQTHSLQMGPIFYLNLGNNMISVFKVAPETKWLCNVHFTFISCGCVSTCCWIYPDANKAGSEICFLFEPPTHSSRFRFGALNPMSSGKRNACGAIHCKCMVVHRPPFHLLKLCAWSCNADRK